MLPFERREIPHSMNVGMRGLANLGWSLSPDLFQSVVASDYEGSADAAIGDVLNIDLKRVSVSVTCMSASCSLSLSGPSKARSIWEILFHPCTHGCN